MIIKIFLLLIAGGCASALFHGKKLSKFLSLVLAAVSLVLLVNLYQNWQLGFTDKFTYDWVYSQYYPVKINLFSTSAHYALIFPFFIIAVISMLFNSFFPQEEKSLRINGLTSLSLAALILLICSENVIQLLVSACVIDIFGFYMINDSASRRKYIFYNLIADMGLFMLFALIWGYINSIQLTDFGKYAKLGAHKDLVCILLLLCLFIKSGLFMFQTPLMDWKTLEMNRISLLSYLSTPVVGLIILSKTQALLPLSDYSQPLLHFFAAASIAWGVLGILFMDELRQKAIYFNMMLYGLLYGLFAAGFLPSVPLFASLVLCGFLLNVCWLMVAIGSSNETYVSAMGGFLKGLKLTFAITLVVVVAYLQVLLELAITYPYWACFFGGALLIGVSYVMHQIYLGRSHADERVLALLKNPFIVYGSITLGVAVTILYDNRPYSMALAVAFASTLLLVYLSPLRALSRVYDNEYIQSTNWFSDFYRLFLIGPVKILGRVLWLTIDFLIIERTVINSLHKVVMILINVFRNLHADSRWAYPFFLLAGGIMAYFSYNLTVGR